MTTSKVHEVERRQRQRQAPALVTGAADLQSAMLERLDAQARLRWPSTRYREDPVAFCRDVLGVEPWSKQVEILHAVRDHARVAVRAGHKISKSHTAASIALWFYCAFDDARAIMSSTTARQVDQILWRELKMLRARGGRCVSCKHEDPDGRRIARPCSHSALIDGDIGELARTGLKQDFREIVGFTAREAEAVAGISGKNLLYIIDEASGVPEEIFEAIEGNRAGGARIVLFGNPTQNQGEFFEAFHAKKAFYFGITVSSEETPNVVAGREVIPGLATREWIEEKRQEWGEQSPLYKVRVKGEHALQEEGRIFSLHAIALAQERWHETADAGRLFVGLDPAGASGTGDESVFAPRRGLKLLSFLALRGLSEDQHVIHLLSLLSKLRVKRETPVVVLDREGPIGSALASKLRAHLDTNRGAFELVTVRASDRATRKPAVYDRMRDELTANLESWIRDGGALVEDVKLERELHEFEWKEQVNGRLKCTPKDEIKKRLGRSPDRYDALALSVWEPLSLRESSDDSEDDLDDVHAADMDPYSGSGMDPYGGDQWRNRG